MYSVDDVNAMDEADFVEAFGDVAEHSPWVALNAAQARPFAGRFEMISAFETALAESSRLDQLGLIRAHPDLASRARMADDSVNEQAGAGLDRLTTEDFERFTRLNSAYKDKFGFPFIFAVKGADKEMILAAFEERLHNVADAEFRIALEQIARIFRFRIEDRVQP